MHAVPRGLCDVVPSLERPDGKLEKRSLEYSTLEVSEVSDSK